ncbi:MAG: hypothetical protein COB67_08905 [SAR324 cluster bacterium]|uniref:Phage coat protein n=1 Tax=SAR324 cluster bacterium TaxID=2024889 RepID=A0A2A4T0Z1_9DELT|nr:MAG: hypothetical protein COB67_08905 [SAR324 cluster bacterium]
MKNIKNIVSRSKKVLVVAAFTAANVVMAAPVTLPASAQADIDGSIANGGGFALLATLGVIGFGVIMKMAKKI